MVADSFDRRQLRGALARARTVLAAEPNGHSAGTGSREGLIDATATTTTTTTTTTSATTKENAGQSHRRQRQLRRTILTVALASSVSFFLGSKAYRVVVVSTPARGDAHVGSARDRESRVVDRPSSSPSSSMMLDPLDGFMREAFPPDIDPVSREHMEQILSASASLVNLRFGGDGTRASAVLQNVRRYKGIVAEFCPRARSNFTDYHRSGIDDGNPSSSSTTRSCDERDVIPVDLGDAARLARAFDEYLPHDSFRARNVAKNVPTLLDLKGAVFHEGRCGSSASARAMRAANPAGHNRVHVEARAPEFASRVCGEGYSECRPRAAAAVMGDVVYLMSRSDDPREENVFFVFGPESTRTMETFRTAFPTTPWVFLYRRPLEAMLSNYGGGEKGSAFSLEPSPMVEALVERAGYEMRDVTTAEMHAVQMATFCLSALRNFRDADGLGMALKYSSDLVDDFTDTILPEHFHAPVDGRAKKRIAKVAREGGYSEDGMGPGPLRDDHDDREEINISNSTRKAAEIFLQRSYRMLEESAYNVEKCRTFRGKGVVLRCEGLVREES